MSCACHIRGLRCEGSNVEFQMSLKSIEKWKNCFPCITLKKETATLRLFGLPWVSIVRLVVVPSVLVPIERASYCSFEVTATDGDASSFTPSFALVGGVDQGLFQLQSNGVLAFSPNAPVFATPADSDQDNVYEIEVTVSDGALTSVATTISITVTECKKFMIPYDLQNEIQTHPSLKQHLKFRRDLQTRKMLKLFCSKKYPESLFDHKELEYKCFSIIPCLSAHFASFSKIWHTRKMLRTNQNSSQSDERL